MDLSQVRDPHHGEAGQRLSSTEMIEVLGTILQTAATVAGISVALVATLETLPDVLEGALKLPSEVIGLIGWAAASTLVACSFCLRELWKGARQDRNRSLEWPIALLFSGIALLGIGFFLLAVPEAFELSELLRRLR